MRWAITLLLIGACSAALGAEGHCPLGRGDYTFVLKALQYINETLPHVPPEESRYFHQESAAITTASSSNGDAATQAALARRYNQLASRRLFYVWKVRSLLPAVTTEVRAVENPKIEREAAAKGKFKKPLLLGIFANADANRLSRALSASSGLAGLQTSMEDLLNHEELHNADPLFSNKQYGDLAFQADVLVFDMNEYAKCELAKLAPLKKLIPASH